MQNISRKLLILIVQGCIISIITGIVISAHAERNRSLTVRFPAFSISPGERICGVKLKTSQGRIHTGCMPNRWTCDRAETSVHCYTLHPTFALGISGMIPEMIINNLSDDRPSIEATVEFIDGSGKEYSKDIRQDELIIK